MRPPFAVLLIVALEGCAVWEQTGFLSHNAQLRQQAQNQAPLVYTSPGVDWTKYSSAILMPVQVWDSPDTTINQHDQTMLSSYYYCALRGRLSSNLRIVDPPSPGVLTIRVALTNPTAVSPVMRAISIDLPQECILSSVKNLAKRSYAFVRSAHSESEILNSVTGEQLATAVDPNVSRSSTTNAEESGGAEHAMDLWAERLDQRLTDWRLGPET